jgi:trehalose 6-phosphate phosphatase
VSAAVELLAEVPKRSGLCCDFDGTIAPIVLDPEDARPLPGAVAALHDLARELAVVAAVSGRPAAFLADRLELTRYRSPLRVIGLHGLEEAFADGPVRPEAAALRWRPVIESARDQLVAGLPPAVRVEDKSHGIAVHWRGVIASGDELEAIAARATELARATAAAHGLLARPGKASVELVLPLGIDKGSVVRGLCDGLARAAFLGDDTGDLLAFRALDELGTTSGLRALKVAVTGDGVPPGLLQAADLVLDGPAGAVGFLVALAERLRPP